MRGYTLLELIVSLAIFSIVITIVMGAYLTLISLDREIRSTNETVTNLSFAADSMARTIRTGTRYACVPPSDSDGNGLCSQLNLLDSSGNSVRYTLKNDHTIGECYDSGSGCSYVSITDPRITIDTLLFNVTGEDAGSPSDNSQPQVTFTIHGMMPTNATGNKSGTSTDFTIQTSATQRQIDL